MFSHIVPQMKLEIQFEFESTGLNDLMDIWAHSLDPTSSCGSHVGVSLHGA